MDTQMSVSEAGAIKVSLCSLFCLCYSLVDAIIFLHVGAKCHETNNFQWIYRTWLASQQTNRQFPNTWTHMQASRGSSSDSSPLVRACIHNIQYLATVAAIFSSVIVGGAG